MKILLVTAVGAALLALVACRSGSPGAAMPAPRTVARVDLNRYLGQWYEIARYPNRLQKNCLESRALYRLRDDGDIDVINSCRDVRDGREREAKGRAWVVDQESNARLKVSFFWPFRGDYWILDLGPSYEYAVVGPPNRKYLWILARAPFMDDELYTALLRRVAEQGFDPARLVRN